MAEGLDQTRSVAHKLRVGCRAALVPSIPTYMWVFGRYSALYHII